MPKLTRCNVDRNAGPLDVDMISFVKLYASDWALDTGSLSTEACGSYVRLCMTWWTSRNPLPHDTDVLARMLCLDSSRSDSVLREIAHLFRDVEGGMEPIRFARYRKEAVRRMAYSARGNAAKSAKRSVISSTEKDAAQCRWEYSPIGRPSLDIRVEGERAIDLNVDYITKNNDKVKTHTTPVAPPQTLALTNQPAPKIKRARSQCTEAPPGFLAWWDAYPNKSGKAVALQSWLRDNPDPVVLMRALEWQVKSEKWTKDGGKYIPMPATYLNQRRYEDEPVKATAYVSPVTQHNAQAIASFMERNRKVVLDSEDDEDAPF